MIIASIIALIIWFCLFLLWILLVEITRTLQKGELANFLAIEIKAYEKMYGEVE